MSSETGAKESGFARKLGAGLAIAITWVAVLLIYAIPTGAIAATVIALIYYGWNWGLVRLFGSIDLQTAIGIFLVILVLAIVKKIFEKKL
jgi:hypothetical protein